MREDVEAHFAHPHRHQPKTHQIWNYWHVPGLYTYLRTLPEKIIVPNKVDMFIVRLRVWSVDTLGLGGVSWPYLSLYINGCGQALHNDSKNGRFAFVYSLTQTDRHTIGGQTSILREGDLFRLNLHVAKAGAAFRELIEPQFNRLIVFDDRLIHGVERVDGSMDPLDGRCVLHGHIEESGPIIDGKLGLDAIRDGICTTMDQFIARWQATIQQYHGPLVLRFIISPSGRVVETKIVLDRVMHDSEGDVNWDAVRQTLIEAICGALFPSASGETNVTLPVTFGGARATRS
jgi:hypothetical protein